MCQPSLNYADITNISSDLLNTLSHHSLVEANQQHVLVDFKGKDMLTTDLVNMLIHHLVHESIYGTQTIFAPVSHSITADSGIGDLGLAGIDMFKDTHQCTSICEALKLLPL